MSTTNSLIRGFSCIMKAIELSAWEDIVSVPSYDVYIQDHYDVGSKGTPQDKYKAFGDAIWHERQKRLDKQNFFAINGMNAVQCRSGWNVCEYMNNTVADNLAADSLTYPYKQPLGIVLADFLGQEDTYAGNRHFHGMSLLHHLVDHNTRWRNH